MSILTPEEVGFCPERLAMPSPCDGIAPSTASIIVRELGVCPNCESDLDPDVTDAKREDRDVLWTERILNSKYHSCASCRSSLRIFVEEKAFGTIGGNRVPDEPNDSLFFIPIPETESFIMFNMFQVSITVANNAYNTTDCRMS